LWKKKKLIDLHVGFQVPVSSCFLMFIAGGSLSDFGYSEEQTSIEPHGFGFSYALFRISFLIQFL